eukprot:2395047-Rhodomonas_salina.3
MPFLDSTYRMLNVAGARRPALIPIRGNGIDFTVAECKEGLAFSFQLPPGERCPTPILVTSQPYPGHVLSISCHVTP